MRNIYRTLRLLLVCFSFAALCTGCRSWAVQKTLSLADNTTGCIVENPLPPIYTSVRFTGDCSEGRAHGQGKAVFYSDDGVLAMEYEGMFADGELHGGGRALVHQGSYTIEGQWQNGCPVECVARAYPPVFIENPLRGLDYEQLRIRKEAEFDISKIQPFVVYPARAQYYDWQGNVVIRVLLSRDGEIAEAYPLPEQTTPQFTLSALNAIFQSDIAAWPATMNDVAVPMWITIPIRYKLR